jgi:hypothetical protein
VLCCVVLCWTGQGFTVQAMSELACVRQVTACLTQVPEGTTNYPVGRGRGDGLVCAVKVTAKQVDVKSSSTFLQQLEAASHNRSTSSTLRNMDSSRSHAFYRLTLFCEEPISSKSAPGEWMYSSASVDHEADWKECANVRCVLLS